MEDKHTSVIVLGIVSVIAIICLVMLFTAAKTGGVLVEGSKTYANTQGNPFPYYQDALHSLPIQSRSPGQIDWDWRSQPEHTYGAKMGVCSILATPEIGKAPAGYTWDADQQEAEGRNCIRITDSQKGWCCKPPSQ